jgi:hypothetical protein
MVGETKVGFNPCLAANSYGVSPFRELCGRSWLYTNKQKTHKTDAGKVVYRWHPMYGRELLIQGERNRAGAIVLICTITDDERRAVLEIPAWMPPGKATIVFYWG